MSYLAPDARGFVSPDALERLIDDDTVLVSVQMANSEVGSIQPIAELARVAHGARRAVPHRRGSGAQEDPVDVEALGVDAARSRRTRSAVRRGLAHCI